MNITTVVKSALALATLSLPSLSAASQGYMADVKVALTISLEQDSIFEKEDGGDYKLDDEGERISTDFTTYSTDNGWTYHSEEGTKVMSFRYGTREILEDLLLVGNFPSGETSIKGWSIKEVFNGTRIRYFLFKKDTPPMWLDKAFEMTYDSVVSKNNIKTKVDYDRRTEEVKSAKGTGTSAAKGMLSLTIRALTQVSVTGTARSVVKPVFLKGYDEATVTRLLKAPALGGTGAFFYDELFAEGALSTGSAVVLEDVEAIFGSFETPE